MKNENVNVVKMTNKDVKFSEVGKEVEMDFIGEGRDIVVFDYNNDDDLDVFVVRNGDTGLLFMNELNGLNG